MPRAELEELKILEHRQVQTILRFLLYATNPYELGEKHTFSHSYLLLVFHLPQYMEKYESKFELTF